MTCELEKKTDEELLPGSIVLSLAVALAPAPIMK